MINQKMNRRNFIKSLGSLLLGIFVVPFGRFLQAGTRGRKQLKMREARFYTSSKDLAG